MSNIKKAKETKDPMEAVLKNIEKIMGNAKGKPAFSRFGNLEVEEISVIPFGVKAIDEASYCGGVPRGRIVELFGPESSGKSLLSLKLIAEAQKLGLEAALLDIEQSFDPEWAKKQGVNVDKLVYSNTFDNGEQAMEYAVKMSESGAFGIIVIDSTAALIPKSEVEGTLEDNAVIGEQARMLSRALRKLIGICGKSNTTIIFINQIREKIGVMFGDKDTTPGGRALKFYAHQRIKVVRYSAIKVKEGKTDRVVGQKSRVTFVKNKVARPFGKCEMEVIFDQLSLNPVVILANSLRASKIISVRNGTFRIKPGMVENEDTIETNTTTMPELANYLIEKEYVLPLIEKLEEEDIEGGIDDLITQLKNEANISAFKITDLPAPKIDSKKSVDATKEEVGEDIKDQDNEPDDE